ncbi:MAG: hypothetical protein FJX77_00720 [Armatimonadetes bacterium]|nr:hypothetical protein [Armatimonadota bacterium]
MRLGVRQSDSAKYGRFRRVSAETQWQLHPRVQVSGEVGHRSADEAPGIFTYGLGLAARPTSTVLFEASQQQGVTQSTARERNRLVRVTAQPSSVFRAQLGFQDNALEEPDRLAATRNALWNFQAGGNRRYVKLDGHSGLVTRPGQDPYLESLYRVEVRPAGAFSLFTSLREVEQKDAGHSLLGLGTTLFLRKGVEVTATHRQPGEDTGGKNDAAGQGLQLKLAPSGSLKLFGGYNFRPEDPRGALLDETHQTLGLETQVGSVALLGSMTYLDRPTSVASEQRWDLLATLSLGDATRLFAGYRTREGGLADRVFGRSYRFGVSQGVGTSFFLLLEGEVGYAFDPAGARSLDPDSTRAQARFGLKF